MARDLISGLLNMNIGQATNKVGIVYLDIDKVIPSNDNFYHINDDDIKMMAYAIEAVGQIEQPLLVKKIADSDKYELIAGHKRRAGANYLVEQGKGEYRSLPCIVKDDAIENELSLILTNSTQRELTSFEKMKQVEILRNYIEKYEIKGNKREIIANIINLSKSEIGRLENISKNLTVPLKEEFQAGTIATGTANEIASMPPEQQAEVQQIIKKNGTIKMGEVKAIKEESAIEEKEEDKPIEGQMQIEDYPEVLTDKMKEELIEANRKKLVELYFELSGYKDDVINICLENISNTEKARKIQHLIASSGYCGGGSNIVSYTFRSVSKGIELNSSLEGISEETYTYAEFLKYFEELYFDEIRKKKVIADVSDTEFMNVLEKTWRDCCDNYERAVKNPSEIANKGLLKLRIIKEAMDMYRNNYKSEKEANKNGF